MDNVLNALFYALSASGLATRTAVGPTAFLGGRYHPFLEAFKKDALVIQQFYKPAATDLEGKGFFSKPDIAGGEDGFSVIVAALPKNMTEARHVLAKGVMMLREGGSLVCAAGNKAGGARLKGILEEFSLNDIGDASKNKARSAWGERGKIFSPAVLQAVREGAPQRILSGSYISCPGLFSWNEIDKGSEILASLLPPELPGRGADFGCGYGYLSRRVAQHCAGVERIFCVDADWRAIEACRMNMEGFNNAEFMWEDLTKPLSALKNLDWIVMNPPYHEGKSADPSIGRAFIATAADSLKPGGYLWMVANRGLAYERQLERLYKKVEKKIEAKGFKVYCAVK